MVALEVVKASNAHLPTRLVGVFVGATSGINEYTLKTFAKRCQQPKAYFIGRSQAAGDRILTELKQLNAAGEYHFVKSDIGLIKNVDTVCADIKQKEPYINILTLSQGTFASGIETAEGLHLAASLIMQSRARFIANLLPLLRQAPDLRRVVSVFTGTKEGPMPIEDLQFRNLPGSAFMKFRGQAASIMTLYMEKYAAMAPEVGFVHDFPGPVRSNIARDGGFTGFMMRSLFKVVGPFVYIPNDESGERHLFLATSSRYPAKEGGVDGVALEKGLEVVNGSDGVPGSGCYTVDEKCESGNEQVVETLKGLRKEGKAEAVWKHIQDECIRITGKESI